MNEAQFLMGLGLESQPTRPGLATPFLMRNIGTCDRVRGETPGNHVWDSELGGTVFCPRTPGGAS